MARRERKRQVGKKLWDSLYLEASHETKVEVIKVLALDVELHEAMDYSAVPGASVATAKGSRTPGDPAMARILRALQVGIHKVYRDREQEMNQREEQREGWGA